MSGVGRHRARNEHLVVGDILCCLTTEQRILAFRRTTDESQERVAVFGEQDGITVPDGLTSDIVTTEDDPRIVRSLSRVALDRLREAVDSGKDIWLDEDWFLAFFDGLIAEAVDA